MAWVLSFLLGSRLGRLVGAIGLTAAVVLLVSLAAYRKGIKAERVRQKARQLNNIRKRMEVDDEVARMSRADRRRELERWMR
ncbi:MAG: hypothetical protein D6773_11880 [Alphaproteobacteria bacterium]|nr:MAG: hypothetical protein D6773_11880 [Alphaproteobacteria bacterium]